MYRALLPGMRLPQSMMIGISSPYKKSGLLFKRWREHFGKDTDDVCVIQAASDIMNPMLDTCERDRAMIEDPAAAASEWGAAWREDLVSLVDPAVVDRCVVPGRTALPPIDSIQYVAGVDPSGGSSDSMTLSVSHAEGERGILDYVGEWRPPFSPEIVVREIADICRRYGIRSVVGDRFGGEWIRERFRVHGIDYQLASMSRSDLYPTLLPALNTPAQIELLDNKRLVSQLCALERRTARSGKDSIDHPAGMHDDLINAAAISLVRAALAPRSSADNWLEYYRRLNAKLAAPHPSGDLVRVVVPTDQWPSTIIGISGANYTVQGSREDRFVMMSSDDAKAFIYSPTLPSSGWEMKPNL